eukprot:jgi/Ulvmu1/3624/UM017_0036.1
MEVFNSPHNMRAWSREKRADGRAIGFVPTMGSLHEGHLHLVKSALSSNDVVIVSIYVNPTQFAEGEDFEVYPKQLEADLAKLAALGTHAVFAPDSLYNGKDSALVSGASSYSPGDHDVFVVPEAMQKPLCGKTRPHFFRGVATAVTKLFNIVEPDSAVFGTKDYQQYRIVTTLVRDLNFDIKIIPVDIQREIDGLAMSSRNTRLTPDSRKQATCILQGLNAAMGAWQAGLLDSGRLCQIVKNHITDGGGEVDYVEAVDAEHLQPMDRLADRDAVIAVAAWFEGREGIRVRLIDNVHLRGVMPTQPKRSLDNRASLQSVPTVS